MMQIIEFTSLICIQKNVWNLYFQWDWVNNDFRRIRDRQNSIDNKLHTAFVCSAIDRQGDFLNNGEKLKTKILLNLLRIYFDSNFFFVTQ